MASSAITLDDLLAATGGQLRGSASPELRLGRVCLDSRAAGPGALFVALRGQKHDGHDFVADAFARGAAAALVERIPTDGVLAEDSEGPPLVLVPSTPVALRALARYRLERRRAAIVVVAGSTGLATTAELTAAVLRQRYGAVQASALERPDLQVPLALLGLNDGVSRLVLALRWADPDELERALEPIRPSAVVITNVQRSHRETAGSLEELAGKYGALVERLPATGTVVLNADDERARALAAATRASPVYFGLGPAADVRAASVVGRGRQGTELDLVVAHRTVHVRMPLLGLNSVHSALAAASVGLADGLELREIGAGLQTASPTTRILVATGLNGSRIIEDSYNASPESDLEALNLLADLSGRKIAVLGDMLGLGKLEATEHRKVGNRAASVVDSLVTVGERARLMADEARRMGLSGGATFEAATNEEAIDHLRRRLRPGDTVLVKGSRELGMDTIVQALRLEG